MKTWQLACLWPALLHGASVDAQIMNGETSEESAHGRWESYTWSTETHTRFRASTWALDLSSHSALLNASMTTRDCSVALWTVRVEYADSDDETGAQERQVQVNLGGETLDWTASVKTVARNGQLWAAVVNRDTSFDIVDRFSQARGALVEIGADVALLFSLNGFGEAYERLESLCRSHSTPTSDSQEPAAPLKLRRGSPAYG